LRMRRMTAAVMISPMRMAGSVRDERSGKGNTCGKKKEIKRSRD